MSEKIEPFALRHKKDIVYMPHDPTVDPPPRTCFKCRQPGHNLQKCTALLDRDVCFNCGREGVKMSNCPRCHVAWRKHCSKADNNQINANAESENKDEDSAVLLTNFVENLVPIDEKSNDKLLQDPLQDIKDLIESIRHLSVATQEMVVQQVILERREMMEQRKKAATSSQQNNNAKLKNASNGAVKKKTNCQGPEKDNDTLRRGFPKSRQDNEIDQRIAQQETHRFMEKRRQLRERKDSDNLDDFDDW